MAISYAIIHRGGPLPCPPQDSPRRSRCVSCSALPPPHANIVKLEITRVEPAGPTHERITGKAYGELDPADPKNAVITDIELAPRNARGKVEYVTTFTLVRPTEMMRVERRPACTPCVNRGGGNADAASGWSRHVRQRLAGGRRANLDESHHSGACCEESRRFEHYRTARAAVYESDRTHHAAGDSARPAFAVPAGRRSTRRRRRSSPRPARPRRARRRAPSKIPSTDWAFADCSTTPFPGTPDPGRICVKNGFDPALLYELQYTVKDPLVLGIGLAATRDLGAFFQIRESRTRAGTPNPVAGTITHAISEGSSQSGTFLQTVAAARASTRTSAGASCGTG